MSVIALFILNWYTAISTCDKIGMELISIETDENDNRIWENLVAKQGKPYINDKIILIVSYDDPCLL